MSPNLGFKYDFLKSFYCVIQSLNGIHFEYHLQKVSHHSIFPPLCNLLNLINTSQYFT